MIGTIPTPQQTVLDSILKSVESDPRFCALLSGGSLLHGGFDEHSDLDLIVVVNDTDYDSVMAERRIFAQSCGDLLAAFTGEHVGEPRLLICLYAPDAIHVDLKFVTKDTFSKLIECPHILWSNDPSIEAVISAAEVQWPDHPPDWFEDRFWIWVHYAATKIARGELFEAIGMLSFIREQVLGPLIHQHDGRPQRGVRRLEESASEFSERLERTIPKHERNSVLSALHQTITLYDSLSEFGTASRRARARILLFVNEI